MKRLVQAPLILILLFLALGAGAAPARAQSPDDQRFILNFIEDAAVVEDLWVEGQVRWQDLSKGLDSTRIGPVIAFSPLEGAEVGGRIDIVDTDFNPSSQTGLGDTTLFGKWQFIHNPIQFTIGAELFVPTGDEDEGLGTGELDASVFVAVRKNLENAYVNGFLGFRSNSDSNIRSGVDNNGNGLPGPTIRRDGKTSVFLGAGAMFPASAHFSFSLELSVETERFERGDSAVEVMAGGYWFPGEHFSLRAGLGVGLDDGAPDWESVFGAAWHY
ncbi:MAG: hypothetical protein ACE5ID_05155 [Acidobacteriota bacterium]